MIILNTLVTGITLGIILFKWLDWSRLWKFIFKIPSHQYTKPFDCFRCNIFWITQLVGLYLLPDWKAYLIFSCYNFVASHIIDKID